MNSGGEASNKGQRKSSDTKSRGAAGNFTLWKAATHIFRRMSPDHWTIVALVDLNLNMKSLLSPGQESLTVGEGAGSRIMLRFNARRNDLSWHHTGRKKFFVIRKARQVGNKQFDKNPGLYSEVAEIRTHFVISDCLRTTGSQNIVSFEEQRRPFSLACTSAFWWVKWPTIRCKASAFKELLGILKSVQRAAT